LLIREIDGLAPVDKPSTRDLPRINLGQQKDAALGKNPALFGKYKVQG
jgi:hypothetical protein